jgi:general secretion pathway protein A
MPKIHRLTRGVPRRINLLCDRALLGAYAAGSAIVTPAIIAQAASEVFGTTSNERPMPAASKPRWRLAAAGITGIALTGAAAWAWQQATSAPDPAVQAVLAAQAGSFKLSHNLSGGAYPHHPPASAGAPSLMPAAAQQAMDNAAWSDLLGDATRDEAAAFRLLGQLWGMALEQEDPCTAAQGRNMRCFHGTGGLAELRRLNRPAILKLVDDEQAGHHAVLVGLSDTSAELRIAGRERNLRIDLEELSSHFRGEFVSFWRTPPGYTEEINLGDKGEAVDWINAQLSRLSGGIESVQGQPYGAAMVRQVRQFQQAQGLPADGIAGARTLMLLNRAAGVQEPQLRTSPTLAAAFHGE